jgi:hypothetical protein
MTDPIPEPMLEHAKAIYSTFCCEGQAAAARYLSEHFVLKTEHERLCAHKDAIFDAEVEKGEAQYRALQADNERLREAGSGMLRWAENTIRALRILAPQGAVDRFRAALNPKDTPHV